jgi:dienelactone hydrolase
MPDFFEPHGAFPSEKFPPKTDQDKADIQAFFGGPASPPAASAKLKSFSETLKANGAKKIGVYGFCWGKYG